MKPLLSSLSANLSLLFTESPLLERFGAAKAAGFQRVEIQFPYTETTEALLNALDSTGLDLDLINVPAGDFMMGGNGLACVPSCEEAFKDAVEQALEYAKKLNVKKVNLLAGRLAETLSRQEAEDVFIANLKWAVPYFEKAGVLVLCEAINTEDMPRFLLPTLSDVKRIIEAVQHPNLKIQADLYHMARMKADLFTELAAFMPWIGHLQFADAPDRHEPDTGVLPFEALFAQTVRLGYAGTYAAEYRPAISTPVGLDWMKKYFKSE